MSKHLLSLWRGWVRRVVRPAVGTRRPRRRTLRPLLELLEVREVPTISATPAWVPEGPAPIVGNNIKSVGAVQAVAVDPGNPDHIYAATVNGGIWLTTDATAADPHWDLLTDQMPSLSIGSIALSPNDPNVVYAGYGSYTSSAIGSPASGVLRSSDGGNSWSQLAGKSFSGARVGSIL